MKQTRKCRRRNLTTRERIVLPNDLEPPKMTLTLTCDLDNELLRVLKLFVFVLLRSCVDVFTHLYLLELFNDLITQCPLAELRALDLTLCQSLFFTVFFARDISKTVKPIFAKSSWKMANGLQEKSEAFGF